MAELLSVQVSCQQQRLKGSLQGPPSAMGAFENSQDATPLNLVSHNRISNDLRKKVPNSARTGAIMTRLPTRTPVDIHFTDLSYYVTEGKNGGYKTILKGVSGEYKTKRLTAIMGPSGAGKSTLMNIIAGYRISNVTGNITVNGRERNLRKFRKMSCYIMQDDHLHPHMSVMESMKLSANLKLGDKVNRAEKEEVINEILETLNLTDCQDTRASDLSGGQRKRLSIALELMNNPPIMFFDEPTSGLDSSSSFQCINLLKTLAQGGRNIVCTIHQPSAKLFEKFDYLYCLADGYCIYRGITQGLVPFLSTMGLDCPSYHNPADFLLEVASGEYGELSYKLASSVKCGKCDNFATESDFALKSLGGNAKWRPDGAKGQYIELYVETSDPKPTSSDPKPTSNDGGDVEVAPTTAGNPLLGSEESTEDIPHSFQTSGWRQFLILFNRTFLSIIRDGLLTKIRVISHLLIGLLIGLLYYQIGNDAGKVIDNTACIFFCMLFLMFTAMMPTILTFPLEMNVFIREHLNYWYSLKSYYLAKTMADMPFQIVYPLVYVIIVYFMTGQPMELDRFLMFTTMCIMTSLAGQSLGISIGAATNVQGAVFLGPITSIPILLFSGFFVKFSTIPVYLRWITYMSYVRYGFEGAMLSIYGFDRKPLHCSQGYCHYRITKKLLQDSDIEGAEFWMDFLFLFLFFLFFRIAGYVVLRWKLNAER